MPLDILSRLHSAPALGRSAELASDPLQRQLIVLQSTLQPSISSEEDGDTNDRPFTDRPMVSARIQTAIVASEDRLPMGVAEGSVLHDPHEVAMALLDLKFKRFSSIQQTMMVLHKLGQGGWSQVYCVEDRAHQQFYALKVVPLHGGGAEGALASIKLLKKLDHPNIIKYYDHFTHTIHRTTYLCMKLEYCSKGSLRDLIRQKQETRCRSFSTSVVLGYISQLASALAYFHGQEVLHGDICPENVVCSSDMQLKLIGIGGHNGPQRKSLATLTITGGQRTYSPPEWSNSALQHGRPLHSMERPLSSYDMWSLGCILSELATLKLLKEDRLKNSATSSLTGRLLEKVFDDMRIVHHGLFCAITRRLLDYNPENRMTAVELGEALGPIVSETTGWLGILRKLSVLRVSSQP